MAEHMNGQRSRTKLGNTLMKVVIAVLLVYVGTGIEYRYKLFQKHIAQDEKGRVTQLAELLNTEVPDQEDVDFQIFWEVWDILQSEHLDAENLTTASMVDGALRGLVSSADDPYSYYLAPDDFKQTGENMAGRFYGVGIELGYTEDILSVVSPLKGSPAEAAGVQAGDLIIHVKDEAKGVDEDSGAWSLEKAVKTIRGEKGTPITLTLLREGESEPLNVELIRGEIKVPSLEMEIVEHNGKRVAHVMLSQFGQNTQAEWEQIVAEIVREKAYLDGIALDVRGNSGGFLNTAISLASDFYKKGTVVIQQGKWSKQEYNSKGTGRLEGIPTVVLVNRGSASASEILAGALRDQIGAKLVGERTFGKGTVQDRKELSNGGGIHVTISRWMLPAGDWIHDEGIPVDVEVAFDRETEEDEQLLRAIEEL